VHKKKRASWDIGKEYGRGEKKNGTGGKEGRPPMARKKRRLQSPLERKALPNTQIKEERFEKSKKRKERFSRQQRREKDGP